MGNEFSCTCCKEEEEKKSFSKQSLEEENYLPKIKKSDLMFSHTLELSCSYLVKNSQLLDFFKNRSFFVYNDKKSSNCYYNQLFFLDINEENFNNDNRTINSNIKSKKDDLKYIVILKYDEDFENSYFTPFNSELFANLSSKYNEYSGKYDFFNKSFENLKSMNDYLMIQKERSMNLCAISNMNNLQFNIVFKYTTSNNKCKYIFEKLQKIDKDILSNILNSNSKRILKFIVKIKNSYLIKEMEEEKEISENENANYLLIFEECYESLDYVVVEVKKKNDVNINNFIKEVTYRINSTSVSNRISCVFYDNGTAYIVIILKD